MNSKSSEQIIQLSVAELCEQNGLHRTAESISREVLSGYSGGKAEYVMRLLEVAKNKGVDYLQKRMLAPDTLDILPDGMPVIVRSHDMSFVQAVIAQAKALGYGDSGEKPALNVYQSEDPNTIARTQDVKGGKSDWLKTTVPYSEFVEKKRQNKLPEGVQSYYDKPKAGPQSGPKFGKA